MESVSLNSVADEQLGLAREAHSGRAAHTVHGGVGHFLRQTVIALTGGTGLAEHESPGEATLQVLAANAMHLGRLDDAERILTELLTPGGLFPADRTVVVATHHLPGDVDCPTTQVCGAGATCVSGACALGPCLGTFANCDGMASNV